MYQQNNPARIRAKRVMRHYFSMMLAVKGARAWSRDNDAEIDNLVDDIIQAAADQIEDKLNPIAVEKPEFPYGEFDDGKHWQGEN